MRFLPENRPAGLPEPALAGLISAEKVAKELEAMFRDTVKAAWWLNRWRELAGERTGPCRCIAARAAQR